MANSNFDTLLSTTLANYRDQLTDNIFTARPLTYTLMEKGRIRMLNGGTKIVEPLIYGLNGTVGSYGGYDTLNLAPQTGISAAEFEWKQYAASISISGIEEAKNNGEEQIINLLEAKSCRLRNQCVKVSTQCFLLMVLATRPRTGTVLVTWLNQVTLLETLTPVHIRGGSPKKKTLLQR